MGDMLSETIGSEYGGVTIHKKLKITWVLVWDSE
jgi:hypothetical protein